MLEGAGGCGVVILFPEIAGCLFPALCQCLFVYRHNKYRHRHRHNKYRHNKYRHG
jgi:hypothetical protein